MIYWLKKRNIFNRFWNFVLWKECLLFCFFILPQEKTNIIAILSNEWKFSFHPALVASLVTTFLFPKSSIDGLPPVHFELALHFLPYFLFHGNSFFAFIIGLIIGRSLWIPHSIFEDNLKKKLALFITGISHVYVIFMD